MKDDVAEAIGAARMIVPQPAAQWRLCVLGHWKLTDAEGAPRQVPGRAADLMSFLAVHGQAARTLVSGSLWPESTESHAQTNLRTTSAVLQKAAPGVLLTGGGRLDLAPTLVTDLGELREAIAAVMACPASVEELKDATRSLLVTADVLPECDAEWVLHAREQTRVDHLQALTVAAEALVEADELSMALAAAQTATVLDPLAESAHRLLTRIHLDRGDRVKAYVTYEDFRRRSIDEFGLGPSGKFKQLVEPLTAERTARLEAEQVQRRRRRRSA